MKSLVVAASAVALLAIPAMAQAQETRLYGTVGYAHLDSDDGSLGAIQGRLGARFGQYFGVEGEGAFGVKGEEVTVAPGVTGDVEIKHQLGIYGVVFLPASENVDLHARVGYTTAEYEADVTGIGSGSLDLDGWAFGVGGSLYFDGANGVRVDYTRQEYDDEGLDGGVNVWSIAYSRRF